MVMMPQAEVEADEGYIVLEFPRREFNSVLEEIQRVSWTIFPRHLIELINYACKVLSMGVEVHSDLHKLQILYRELIPTSFERCLDDKAAEARHRAGQAASERAVEAHERTRLEGILAKGIATMAAMRNARRSIIPAVRNHLAGYARAGEVQIPRCLSTAAMKGYRPEDDSSLQEEGQGRQGVDVRRREFPDIFNIPFYPLRGLGVGVDELFSNPFTVAPRVNVDVRKPWDAVEDKDALHLRVDMPGLGKDDVRVYAEENSLVIKGEAQSDAELDGSGRKYSSRIDLPPKVYKLDQIKAQMKNGVLKVSVPKYKEEEMKSIINVNID